MSEKFALDASPRDVVGKKVKQLRRQGIVPAVIYGPDFETLPISLDHKLLRQLLLHAGGTQLIELNVDGQAIPTLAREVQRDSIKGDILHVDFYRVAMDRLIRAEIPLLIVGENPMVGREAILIHPLTSVEVEALPANLPPHIDIDISVLTQIGDQIVIGDLVLPRGVTVHANADELVAKLDYPHLAAEEEEPMFVEASTEPERIKPKREEEEEE